MVEVTFYERTVTVREGVFTETTRIEKRPEPWRPTVRDLETGILYADSEHFELPTSGGAWTAEEIEASRARLRDRPVRAPSFAPTAVLRGRVTECTIIGNVWVYGDDHRTHTRLVIEPEPMGYRG